MKPISRVILLLDQHSQWAEIYSGVHKQLRVQTESFEPLLLGDTVDHGLKQWALYLLSYDLALIAVSPTNLAWVRSQLHYARNYLRTPVLAIVRDLQPIAIQDLLDAGAMDFVMDYNVLSELAIRVKILQQRLRKTQSQAICSPQPSAADSELNELLLHDESNALDAYTAAVASRYAIQSHSFQQAKKTVVQRFEKAYIRTALVRNQGNITRAALEAKKHRRSFWELMRKHNIDAEIYRVSACPDSHQFAKISRH